MKNSVLIRNEMPTSFTGRGTNYAVTCYLTMGDVAMFIERELHGYLK